MSEQSTLFAEDFPARISPSLAGAKGSRVSEAASGASSAASLANFDPATSSWKMSPRFSGEESPTFLGTWPRSGMTRNGTALVLTTLAPRISEIEYGLLPTPEASNTKARALRSNGRPPRDFLLPTPMSDDTGFRREKYAQGGTALSTATGGPLNPTWVEWLMGFPLGWTDLGDSATRSSRRSRKSSAAQSSNRR